MAIKWDNESEPASSSSSNGSLLSKPSRIQWDAGKSQGALAQSQSILDTVRSGQSAFTSQGGSNFGAQLGASGLEGLKGFAQGALKTLDSASAFNAGPVGAEMLNAAPELKAKREAYLPSLEPQNEGQKIGGQAEMLAEMVGGSGIIGSVKKIPAVASFLAKRAEKKVIGNAIEAITPRTTDLTPTEYEQLLRQKRVTPKTAFTPPKYILSEAEQKTATKYKDILQDKDPVKNSINVMSKIADEDAAVGEFLRQNNSIFNSGELRNVVSEKMGDITDVTIPEERIAKLKEQVADNFIDSLKKNDMETLWEARKAFDQQIESAFSGSPTLQKEVKKRFRNAIQEFISERTPDTVYADKMRDMTNLFNIEETLATRAAKERGSNAIMQWLKDNPTKAKVIGATPIIGGGVIYFKD